MKLKFDSKKTNAILVCTIPKREPIKKYLIINFQILILNYFYRLKIPMQFLGPSPNGK